MRTNRLVCAICGLMWVSAAVAIAAEPPRTWEWRWNAPAGEPAPNATVCPLKYDKRWAYAFEIDDGGIGAIKTVQPLLAAFHYTDAPPGVAGGRERPFVGVASVCPFSIDCDNPTQMTWDDLAKLRKAEWGIANHSYWHTGNHWDPSQKLSADQFRRELFWSQAMLGMNLNNGQRTLSHFVYPSGDYNYEPYLAPFGLRVGTLVAAGGYNLTAGNAKPALFPRTYMDESVWAGRGAAVMDSFPADGPKAGDLFIDFTHGINDDPASANHKRWKQRLQTIAGKYGKGGADDMWAATTAEVVDYHLAAQQAKVEVTSGMLKVALPDDAPGSPLTIRLDGISPDAALPPVDGGCIYRQANRVWITTPTLGQTGSPMPQPRLKRVYEGPAKSKLTFDKPVLFAGVRLLQKGSLNKAFRPEVRLLSPGADAVSLDLSPLLKWVPMQAHWGRWVLLPRIPNADPIQASSIELTIDPAFKRMEVYAVESEPSR